MTTLCVADSALPHHHHHHLHHHFHQQLVELAHTDCSSRADTMPESGDIEVLAPPRLHLASRRRFDLKLDLASALTGRERGEKKLRLDFLSNPGILTSKLADGCSSCIGQSCHSHQQADDSPTDPPHADRTVKTTTCTFRPISDSDRTLPESPSAFRTIMGSELAAKLRKSRPVLVIDCRPFLAYNSQHIQGALNISCTDRFNRRRLQQGKVGVLDLLAATHGKDHFRRRHFRDIVLYDDSSSGEKVPETDSALHIVLSTLHREGRQPAVLQADHNFQGNCFSSVRIQALMHARMSLSALAVQALAACALVTSVTRPSWSVCGATTSRTSLNVTAHVPQYWHAHGIHYKRIPASDSAQQNLKQYFEEAIEYIDDARQNGASVLIHCHAGVSRSATITIAYILKHTKMAMSDAYKYVKGKRSIISPNFNFLGQLLEFEQDLNQGNSPRILNPRLVELESTV
nr:hypothetical protein BaRGS_008437 [Batillaria attramentaria]